MRLLRREDPPPEPGNPRAAIRAYIREKVRFQASTPDYALELFHPDDGRWVRIGWDGTITAGSEDSGLEN